MTYGGDFAPGDQAFDDAPAGPVIFGLQLTPTILGAMLAVVGLVGAAALVFYLVLPEWETYQKVNAEVDQLRQDLDQQQQVKGQIEKATAAQAEAKQRRTEVMKLFANESALDTLVLDLDKQMKARNADLIQRRDRKLAQCPPIVKQNPLEFERKIGPLATEARFKDFKPVPDKSTVVLDGSYGSAVDGKLQRRTATIEFVGNYDQTVAILQSIERLQPLLVVRGLTSTVPPKRVVEFAGFPGCIPDTEITTKFSLEALLQPPTPN